tara:strand:+ start:49 stop:831 length:783 start_codon:yes stop_codon:yes gene_type:complete
MTEKTVHNLQPIQPWGPIIVKGTLPNNIVKKIDDHSSELLNDPVLAKKYDWSMNLAGNVKQEVRITPDWLEKECPEFVHFLGQMIQSYCSIKPAMNTIKPEKIEKVIIQAMWTVSQWAGDFNPMHVHDGDLSGVLYTRIPKSMDEEKLKEDHYPSIGDIVFSYGDAQHFSENKFQHSPEVGDIFLFPSWLTHCVYPFRTPNEERRSSSFNVKLIPRKETSKRADVQFQDKPSLGNNTEDGKNYEFKDPTLAEKKDSFFAG